jgi:hypothetical protein
MFVAAGDAGSNATRVKSEGMYGEVDVARQR